MDYARGVNIVGSIHRAALFGMVFLLGVTPEAPGRVLPPAWIAFALAWTGMSGYSATVTVFEQKGATTQQEAFNYTFSKPSTATMHVLTGPNAGVTLVWNGGTTVVAHRGSGFEAMFKKTFPLHAPKVTTIRGSSLDQLSFGAILEHAADTAGVLASSDGPTIGGVETDEVTLVPANAIIDTGLTLEVIDLSKVTHLPVRLLGYEGTTLVRRVDVSDVVVHEAP
jgi:outer membrane lipoprotein-sorting protein